jgi:PAS domain S-box-containing protein
MATEDFKRILESLKIAVAIADAKGAILFANDAFEQAAGRERGALANVSLATLFAAADRKRIQQNVARVGEGKAASAFVDASMDGERWVQIAFQPALDVRDKAAGVIAVLQDMARSARPSTR